jgi:hypothetical protein
MGRILYTTKLHLAAPSDRPPLAAVVAPGQLNDARAFRAGFAVLPEGCAPD